jgi:hypothetical protein
MSGFSDAYSNIAKNRALLDNIDLPSYAEMNPELYGYQSGDVKLQQEDPVLKSQQISILNKLAGLSETGQSDADAEGFQKARDIANQEAKAGTENALSDAQRRGVGGSGLEFAMRESANQGGANRALNAGLNQAADSERGRAAYLQAFGNQAGSMRDQNYRNESANTGIINKFNEANTQGRNTMNNNNVDLKNNAFTYNQGLKDKSFNNKMTRATGQMSVNNQENDIRLAQDAQRNAKNNAAFNTFGSLAGIGLNSYLNKKKDEA